MDLHGAVATLHDKTVFRRRIRVLSGHIAEMLPPECESVLDVGCGDGAIDALVLAARPTLNITGIDVFVRPRTHIPVNVFDGVHIPMDDGTVDVVLLIDVLHHTDDPNILLAEARRVARMGVLVKDHTRESWLGGKTLTLMDWVGNRGHGVRLPYHYWSWRQWKSAWERLNLLPVETRRTLGLYPAAARPIFERGLHMLTFLKKG